MELEKSRNRMKLYNRCMIGAILILIVMLLISMFVSDVESVKLSQGDVYDFNTGWTLTYADGTVVEIDSLPYVKGGSAAYETVLLETDVPEEYWGKTLFFLTATVEMTVYMDDTEIYSYATHNNLVYGHSSGSNLNFIDLPQETSEGHLRIEMSSPYANSAAYITSMQIADRDIAILKVLTQSTGKIIISITILFSGILLFVLDIMQMAQKRTRYGMGYLGVTMIFASFYYIIETKIFHIWYGNQVAMGFLVLAFHMLFPITFTLYYMASRKWYHKKILQVLLILSFVDVVGQVVVQLLDIKDFINMTFYSHLLVFAELVLIIIYYLQDQMKQKKSMLGWIEIFALLLITGGSAYDLLRYNVERVGDFAKWGRIGTILYVLLVIFINIRRMIADATLEIEQQNEMLIASEHRADQANRAKSEFLSNMSHEIRTPLNTVIGMNEMILREEDNPEIVNYAGAIQNSANALLLLINDILDLSKIEEGKMEIVESEYELASLVADSYNMIIDRLDKKGLEAVVKCDATLPKMLHGDMLRVRQVLINFLTNAVKYSEHGTVTFTIESMSDEDGQAALDAAGVPAEVTNALAEKDKDYPRIFLRMTVQDTGIGMTEESMSKLFQKFERFDLAHNQGIEGTGLGLSITKRLVDLMGGTIQVQSEYGKGSSFTAIIPQGIVDETPIGEFSPASWHYSKTNTDEECRFTAPKAKLLVVDDVEMNLKVFTGLLRRTKCQIDTALSGQECIAHAKKKKYDIIFMDHMMPGMSGVETLEELNKLGDYLNKDTPIIMLTANALSGEREKYLEMGFADYLAKPIRGDQLEKMVAKYLPENKVHREEADGTADTKDKADKAEKEDTKATAEEPELGTTSAEDLKQKIPEMDVDEALEYCAGDEELLIDVLSEYVESNRLDAMNQLFADEDWPNYQVEAHALKSTSLTLGFAELSAEGKELEFAVKEDHIDIIREKHARTMEHYQRVIDALRSALGGE